METEGTFSIAIESLPDSGFPWNELLLALPTIVIAFLVLCISFQQYRHNVNNSKRQHVLDQEKLKLDLFEKRHAVFNAVRDFLSIVMRDADIKISDLQEFRWKTADATFLFGDDIEKLLEEIDKLALDIRETNRKLGQDGPPVGEERNKLAEKNSNQLKSVPKYLENLRPSFSPYLKFKNWH